MRLSCVVFMQARKTYSSFDIAFNEAFLDMHLEMRNGRLGLDFSQVGIAIQWHKWFPT